MQSASFESLGLAYDELPPPGSALVVEWSELWADPPDQALLVRLHRGDDEHTRGLVAVASQGRGAALLEAWTAALG